MTKKCITQFPNQKVITCECFMLELAHAKSHLQRTSVQKTANDKAIENHVLAKEYKKT